MAEFALHVLKLNIISAVVIFLVLGLSVLLRTDLQQDGSTWSGWLLQ